MNPVLELRKGRGLTQIALADAAGVHHRTIWRMEQDDGGALLQNLIAVLSALHLIQPLSTTDLQACADRFKVPVAVLARSVGSAPPPSARPPSPTADIDRLIQKLRVAVSELGFSEVEQALNSMILHALGGQSAPVAAAVQDDTLMTHVSPPRNSSLGPNILEQEFRHYSPAPPPAAPTEPQQSPSKHAPKRRPG